MARTRRRKRKTHVPAAPDGAVGTEKVPKSFVLARGKLPLLLRNLHQDLRQVMMPHTASKLKESSRNKLKDFVHVAGPLGVSHFLIMSNTKSAPYLRLAKSPHGPTLTFKIHSYSLAADIQRAQIRPRAPLSIYKSPPLVVLNGFGTAEEHLKLIQIMFQNMFPVINVHTVKLATCQRVLLLNYDKKTKCIDFRHYSISAQPVGATRSIRKLVQRKQLPDLSGLGDVSEFVTRSGYGSESEVEDEASKVELAGEFGKGNHAAHRSAVKLHEIGPRLRMQLVKVEEGLCSGAVMFHEYVKKSPEEVATLRAKVEQREALRKQRKAEQEANVERKDSQSFSKKKRPEAWKEKEESVDREDSDSDDDGQGEPEKEEDKEDDDAEWYRREVGEEPDEAFLSGARRFSSSRPPRGRGGKSFSKRTRSTERTEGTKSDHNGDDRKDRYKKRVKFEHEANDYKNNDKFRNRGGDDKRSSRGKFVGERSSKDKFGGDDRKSFKGRFGGDDRKSSKGRFGGDDRSSSRGKFSKKRGSSEGDRASKRQRYQK